MASTAPTQVNRRKSGGCGGVQVTSNGYDSQATGLDDDGTLHLGVRFTDGSSAIVSARFPEPCSPADVGRNGGMFGADLALNNNDFLVFIQLFFDRSARADIGTAGGSPGSDGLFDNNDFIAFIDLFFEGGC